MYAGDNPAKSFRSAAADRWRSAGFGLAPLARSGCTQDSPGRPGVCVLAKRASTDEREDIANGADENERKLEGRAGPFSRVGVSPVGLGPIPWRSGLCRDPFRG